MPPMPEDVSDHLRRIASGDADASAWLYDAFAGRLHRRLRFRYSALGLDPDELLHDAYLFFLQHDARVLTAFLDRVPEEERTPARLETHLWDLACGVASNHLRSRRARPGARVSLGDDAEATSPDPEEASIHRDLWGRFERCLRARGARLHLYYKLRFVEGLTPEEIVSVTGWSSKATYKLRTALIEGARECARRVGLVPP